MPVLKPKDWLHGQLVVPLKSKDSTFWCVASPKAVSEHSVSLNTCPLPLNFSHAHNFMVTFLLKKVDKMDIIPFADFYLDQQKSESSL